MYVNLAEPPYTTDIEGGGVSSTVAGTDSRNSSFTDGPHQHCNTEVKSLTGEVAILKIFVSSNPKPSEASEMCINALAEHTSSIFNQYFSDTS